MAISLSDKVSTNLKSLNLEGAAWEMPEIEWRKELRKVRVEVKCPECEGFRECRYDAEGKAIPFVGNRSCLSSCIDSDEWVEYRKAARAAADHLPSGYGSCRRCKQGSSYSFGRVKGWGEAEVTVGRPLWPAGTRFSSRYAMCDCHACGKNGITTNTVPLMTRDASGTTHAMWLGVDCASKFFALSKEAKKLAKTERTVLER